MQKQYLSVHFGCGLEASKGWLNFDASPSLRLCKIPGLQRLLHLPAWPADVRYGDVVRGLPVPDRACRRLFCHNMLEHLSLEDAKKALANCHRLLSPDGTFRLFVPDLRCHVETYLSLAESAPPGAAHRFIELLDMGLASRPRGVKGFLHSWLGNSRHLWMWDEAAMTAAVREAGFGRVRRVRYLDSGDPMFDQLEQSHPEWTDYALGVEARH